MPFTPKDWSDFPATTTPITAAELERIEAGIQAAAATAESHASRHGPGGADALKLDDLATPDDNTDLNASTTAHGLLRKLSGSISDFLRGDGTWAAPPFLDDWMIFFPAGANEPPASAFATLDTRNSHPVLDFDAATDESAVFRGVLPVDYAGAGVNVKIIWAATSATAGNVVWNVAFERINAGAMDIDADSFATAVTATAAADSVSGETIETTIAVSNGASMDSLAAGEMFRLKVTRDADNASDTMTGDAELIAVVITEQ